MLNATDQRYTGNIGQQYSSTLQATNSGSQPMPALATFNAGERSLDAGARLTRSDRHARRRHITLTAVRATSGGLTDADSRASWSAAAATDCRRSELRRRRELHGDASGHRNG